MTWVGFSGSISLVVFITSVTAYLPLLFVLLAFVVTEYP